MSKRKLYFFNDQQKEESNYSYYSNKDKIPRLNI